MKNIREHISCDINTGILIWIKPTANRVKVGSIAGYMSKVDGYVRFHYKGKTYLAHRVVWYFMYGVWPIKLLDHEDEIKHHNWGSNLREATDQQNQWHKGVGIANTSGYKGVHKDKNSKKWRAQINHNGKHQHLGCFDTAKEAAEMYLLSAERIHKEFLHRSLVDKLCKLL